jgi:hypothetical protein
MGNDPDAPDGATPMPGLDALDWALESIHGEGDHQCFSTLVPYSMGGPDPLPRIAYFPVDETPPHWHLVTAGFTELGEKESPNPSVSGFGFELTLRLPRPPGEASPPVWAANLLQNLARYVFKTGNVFAAGHHMDANGPICHGAETELTAVLFAPDPQLTAIDTPNGRADFLQVVGITKGELRACLRWRGSGVAEALRESDPWLITDLERRCATADADFARVVAEGARRDGSSTGVIAVETLDWSRGEGDAGGLRIRLDARTVQSLRDQLPGRIPHGRPLTLFSAKRRLHLMAKSDWGWTDGEDTLTLHVSADAVAAVEERLLPRRGEYEIAELSGAVIEVVPFVVKDADGAVVDTVG